MKTINKVAVTGITGHIGYVLAKQLVDRGYDVRGIVRNLVLAKAMPWIADLKIDLAQADMTDQKAMEAALEGQDGFFQVAGVFSVTSEHPDQEVVQKNIAGAESTLRAALATGIKKVIYTSSLATIGPCAKPNESRDESNWNDRTKEHYAKSKVLSERKAWEIATNSNLNLITVLPATMIGPDFHKLNPSLGLIKTGIMGQYPMVPPLNFNFVDVRDVAGAQIRLFENSHAQGRYILANQSFWLTEVLKMMNQIDPNIPLPNKEMPVWFAKTFPLIDFIQHLFTQTPRRMMRGFVKEYVGRYQVITSDKMSRELGWAPRNFRSTLEDTLRWFEKVKV